MEGRKVGELAMAPDNRHCVFQYSREWLADGFSVSPLELPLRQDLFIAQKDSFAGNFGIFDDSIPDGYGRYLLSRTEFLFLYHKFLTSDRVQVCRKDIFCYGKCQMTCTFYFPYHLCKQYT